MTSGQDTLQQARDSTESGRHTPGPWRVFADHIQHGGTYGIDAADGSVVVWFGETNYDGIQRIENARLIAAAPRLLAALKWLCKSFPMDFDMEAAGWSKADIDESCKAYDEAIAAIAAATEPASKAACKQPETSGKDNQA
jgi:hypothetical protein